MADFTAPEPHGLAQVTSLSAATAIGAGAAVDCEGARAYALDVRVTGAPTSVTVALEGTIDGANWGSIGSVTAAGLTWYVDKPVVRVRANLTVLSGGTAPAVTAEILAV